MAAQLYKTKSGRLFHAGAIAIITVGLPARGKTHISRSLKRYLNWLGVKAEAFHLGDFRRQEVGPKSHTFFDPDNDEYAKVKEKVVQQMLKTMIEWFNSGGQVGIFDAANNNRESRHAIAHKFNNNGIQVIFIESICDEEQLIYSNIRNVKILSPDYVGWEIEDVVNDFQKRIDLQTKDYDTLGEEDDHLSYMKIVNVEKIIMNQIQGYLQTRIVNYLMNIHIKARTIYLVRNNIDDDESFNKLDTSLSENENKHTQKVKEAVFNRRTVLFMNKNERKRDLKIWTSTNSRDKEIAMLFLSQFDKKSNLVTEEPHALTPPESIIVELRKSLVQIRPGLVQNLTAEEIKEKYPLEYKKHQSDPYKHRYPRAESYLDLAVRLEPVLLELEREKDDVVIIAHVSVLRCLYAYFNSIPAAKITQLDIPYSSVIEIFPSALDSREIRLHVAE